MKKAIVMLLVFALCLGAAPAPKPIIPAVLALLAGMTTAEVTVGGVVVAGGLTVYFVQSGPPDFVGAARGEWDRWAPPAPMFDPEGIPPGNPKDPKWGPGKQPGPGEALIRIALGAGAGYLALTQNSGTASLAAQPVYNQLQKMYLQDTAFAKVVNGLQKQIQDQGFARIVVSVGGVLRYRILSQAVSWPGEQAIVRYNPGIPHNRWERVTVRADGSVTVGKYSPTPFEEKAFFGKSLPRPGDGEWSAGLVRIEATLVAYLYTGEIVGEKGGDRVQMLKRFLAGDCMGGLDCQALKVVVASELKLTEILRKVNAFEVLTLEEKTFLEMSSSPWAESALKRLSEGEVFGREKIDALKRGAVDSLFRETAEYRLATTDFFKVYYKKIYASCLKILKDRPGVKDAAQDIMIKVLTKANTFRNESSFGSWIYSAVHNHCFDILRAARNSVKELPISFAEDVPETDPNELHLSKEEVLKILEQLKESEKEVLRLFYFEGMSQKDIVEQLGYTLPAVKMRISRAKDAAYRIFKEALDKRNY
jgi:RNA polymerase sigma-70 factor (ECF subfamily)